MRLDSKFFEVLRLGQRVEASLGGGRKMTATLYEDSVPWVDVRSYLAGVPGSEHRDVRRQSFDFIRGRWSKTKTPLTDDERGLGVILAEAASVRLAATEFGKSPLEKVLRSEGADTMGWEDIICEAHSE